MSTTPRDFSLSVNELIRLTTEGGRLHNAMRDEITPNVGQIYHIVLGTSYNTFGQACKESVLRRAACTVKNYLIVGQYKSFFVKHCDGVLLGMASPAEYVAEDIVWYTVLEYRLLEVSNETYCNKVKI